MRGVRIAHTATDRHSVLRKRSLCYIQNMGRLVPNWKISAPPSRHLEEHPIAYSPGIKTLLSTMTDSSGKLRPSDLSTLRISPQPIGIASRRTYTSSWRRVMGRAQKPEIAMAEVQCGFEIANCARIKIDQCSAPHLWLWGGRLPPWVA